MKKKIKEEHWLMLPTDTATGIEVRSSIEETKPQHIYLTSDDPIKPKDWRVEYTINGKFISINNTSAFVSKYDRKIIASTDRDIMYNQSMSDELKIAYIPQMLTDYYIEKQGRIGDIDVEYGSKTLMKPADTYIESLSWLKLTEDNEIIVHIPKEEKKEEQKEMYTRKELQDALFKFGSFIANTPKHTVQVSSYDGKLRLKEPFRNVDKWIKENL